MIPRAGSAYTYGYAVLGELVGWCIGWDLLLEYTAIVAVVAIGISGYFSFLVEQAGADVPAWMLGAPGTGEGGVVDPFAVILCLLIAFLLTQGIKAQHGFETVVVGLKWPSSCWSSSWDTVRGWDAMYVALAEALDAVLVTTDGRLAAASGATCRIEAVTAS